MIISKQFLKSVPTDLKSNIIKKLQSFQEVLQQVEGKIREIPAGYWIRKVKNTEIYKFRLNNSDRILFTYLPKRENEESNILFLNYVSHDEQIRKAINMDLSKIEHTQLEINSNAFNDEEIDTTIDNEVEKDYLDNGLSDIASIIVKEDYIALIVDENNEDFLYYLSEEQYDPLKSFGKPIVLSGAGGTGKTVVVLNKLMDLANKQIKSAYLSYNNLLVEDTKRVFGKFYKGRKKVLPHFDSIKGFYAKYCFVDDKKIVEYYDFIQWFTNERYKFKGIKGIDELSIWTEIRGIIKGYLGLEYSEADSIFTDTSSRIISLEKYKNLPKGYSNFNETEKEAIYKIVLHYQEWLSANDLYDENDLAVNVIKNIQANNIEKYQYLIVDEIQDLSETQLYMLSMLVKDQTNIFFCGDVHQTINPTFFNFGRIKNLYFSNGLDVQDFNLTKNYRNTKEITKLANTLTTIRQSLIGKTSYDYEVHAIRSGKTPIILKADEKKLDYILNTIKDKHYAALIVADEEEKQALTEKFAEAKGRIFTIYEIKGLEYESVFCYNLFSKFQSAWEQILNGNTKRNDQYRYYFNLLYVAISRAKDFLCIIESNPRYIHESLVKDCDFINKADSNDLNIHKRSTETDWAKEAKRLETIGNKEKSNFARDFSSEEFIQNLNRTIDNFDLNLNFIYEEAATLDLNIEKDDFNLKEGIKNLRIRQYTTAITNLNTYIDDYPTDPDGYYYLGLVYTYAMAGTDYSIRYFDEALRLKPDWYQVYLDKASSLKFLGKINETLETLDQAIQLNRNIGNAYFIKGLVYQDRMDWRTAADYFEKALKRPCFTFDGINKTWNPKPSKTEERDFKKSIELNLMYCKQLLGTKQKFQLNSKVPSKAKKSNSVPKKPDKENLDYSLLKFDENQNKIIKCEEDKIPTDCSYNIKSKKYVVTFNKNECQLCSKFETCPMKQADVNGKLIIRKKALYSK